MGTYIPERRWDEGRPSLEESVFVGVGGTRGKEGRRWSTTSRWNRTPIKTRTERKKEQYSRTSRVRSRLSVDTGVVSPVPDRDCSLDLVDTHYFVFILGLTLWFHTPSLVYKTFLHTEEVIRYTSDFRP